MVKRKDGRVGAIPTLPTGVELAPYIATPAAREIAIQQARDSVKNLVRSMARAQAWADHQASLRIDSDTPRSHLQPLFHRPAKRKVD